MNLIFDIFLQVFPLFGIVFLGFIAVKYIDVSLDTLGKLTLYVLNPVIFFHGAYTVEPQLEYLFIPLLYWVVATGIAFVFFSLGKIFWKDHKMNHLLGYTAGASNVGFLGYPLVIMILGDEYFGIATMIVMGFALYENTTGLFLAANGKYSLKDSLLVVAKIPTVYAFVLGVVLNFGGIDLLPSVLSTTESFKGAYTVIGMMIIGGGLAHISFAHFDAKLITWGLFTRLAVWPLLAISGVLLDFHFLHFYSADLYAVMLLLSTMSLAGSTVVFANEFHLHAKKAAVLVSLSLFVSLFTIPLYWAFFSEYFSVLLFS